MTKFFKFALFAILSIVGASAFAQSGTTAATVNGVAISQERVDLYVKAITSQTQQKDTPELRKAVLSKLEELELLSQEAVRLGLDKDPGTHQDIELSRQNVLANALVQNRATNTVVTEEALRSEYETVKSDLGTQEYNVRHILVGSEDEAKALVAKLKKGGDFEKLAKAESKDAGSKDQGGELGWVSVNQIPNTFVKPFADAVMSLHKGQVSAPVQSQFGWHVIKLQDVRDVKVPAFEDIKPQLTQRLQQKAVQSYLTDLRSKAKIVEQ
ncbi:MAG: peptidylprolyl isomerase [Gallionellaceae bacterium]|jgi:peptidyl-prolyl cis-trans isomerase C|nr:peptidylprolyl isomerase [Gallionellaceae bacterium]